MRPRFIGLALLALPVLLAGCLGYHPITSITSQIVTADGGTLTCGVAPDHDQLSGGDYDLWAVEKRHPDGTLQWGTTFARERASTLRGAAREVDPKHDEALLLGMFDGTWHLIDFDGDGNVTNRQDGTGAAPLDNGGGFPAGSSGSGATGSF